MVVHDVHNHTVIRHGLIALNFHLLPVRRKMSDRDRADMDRMENNSGDDNGVAVTAEQSTSPPVIEVANVTVSSMVRMATVDK